MRHDSTSDSTTSAAANPRRETERDALARRRSFVIHAFAGLAVASAQGCERDANAATQHASEFAAGPSGKRMGSGPPPPAPRPAVHADASNASDAAVARSVDGSSAFGVIGDGSGYGGGSRMGHRAAAADSPRVRLRPAPTTHGGMDPAVVTRVIRRNLHQLQHCYEQGLAADPFLGGNVTVEFVIGPTGTVLSARGTPTTVPLRPIADCFATAFPRWLFPTPANGANVTVTQIVDLVQPTS